MGFILGLILGAVLGAVFGVTAERLWCRFEHIPRLDIVGSVFQSIEGDGYLFEVTNRGNSEIPPYRIYIYNPRTGSIGFFTKDKEGSQLPNQKIEHSYAMIKDGELLSQFPDFYRDGNNNPMGQVERNEFAFRLVLENSDEVIYENRQLGNAFVRVFQKARETRNVLLVNPYDLMALQCRYEPWHVKALRTLKMRLGKLTSFVMSNLGVICKRFLRKR
ncbi:MAG TPA: hypothetical protein VMW16_09405 [Sedimentisphaerales bacterium]|nr:hypothetical protein [Sedimentisphaerales bacterium]